MARVKFSQNSKFLLYSTCFDSPFKKLDFLTYNGTIKNIEKPASRMRDRGIPEVKKLSILTNLGPLMPPTSISFWKNISTGNLPDLVTTTEANE